MIKNTPNSALWSAQVYVCVENAICTIQNALLFFANTFSTGFLAPQLLRLARCM